MLNKAEIKRLLSARFKDDKHISLSQMPLPSCFKDIEKAANRIKKAIENDEKVAIVGDYDVDGVISCVILSEFFDDIGFDYEVKIPNRFKDGYGLSAELIKELESAGISLIITVDNGIAALEAGALCKEKGIDLIITDHHTPQNELPQAFAIINPKQKDCEFPSIEICGAQVAWYLVAMIKQVCKINYDLSKFVDLLAIAIVADMMELKDLNRALVRAGLKMMNASKRAAFKAVKAFYQKESFEFEHFGFLIAPLLNSAGRMDDARLAYEFLRTKNADEAARLLNEISSLNEARKEQERELFKQCLEQAKPEDNIIIAHNQGWHEGVLGIVASRLARHFNKPAFVFSENEGKLKGSARSVGQIDILKLIETQSDLLLAFGGHKGAAGLSLERSNLKALKDNLNTLVAGFKKEDFLNTDEILGELDYKEIDFELLQILENFEPYGQKNPKPLFEFKDYKIKLIKRLGKDDKHLKIIFSKEGSSFEALFFNFTKELLVGDRLSFTAYVCKNAFRGLVSPQLIIKELL